jgi:hypothetical protein
MHLHLVHFFLSITFASRFNFETFKTNGPPHETFNPKTYSTYEQTRKKPPATGM